MLDRFDVGRKEFEKFQNVGSQVIEDHIECLSNINNQAVQLNIKQVII